MSQNPSPISTAIEIRPIRSDEVDASLKLIHLSIRTLSTEHYSPDLIEKIVRLYEKPSSLSGHTVVATYQSELVGVASVQFSGFFGTISAVFTHPDFVSKGIGRQLVQALEQKALEKKIWTMIVNSSLTAVAFYEKLEYEFQGKIKINGKISCIILRKQLQSLPSQDYVHESHPSLTHPDNTEETILAVLVAIILLIILL